VVSARAKKLGILTIQGSCDKRASLLELAVQHGFSLDRTLFVGNDVNDLAAMQACGLSACPADSHPTVRQAAAIRLKRRGGDAVVRELVEDVLGLNVGPVHHA
jgi:3-deoxy-D-manno-octulosonate 8-phosphate phosphatase (KDO 8-P phosphatase)